MAAAGSSIDGRDNDACNRPPPDPTDTSKAIAGSKVPVAAAPPAPGKKKAPAPSSTKALVAGDPKRLPRPPAAVAKGSNQKRRRLKAAQTEKAGRNILQSLSGDGDGSVPASISGDGEREVTGEPGGRTFSQSPAGKSPAGMSPLPSLIINLLVRRTSWLNRPGGGGAPTCVNT
ncbi:hypothetical protein PVAP13_3KG548432 [Panicum virgatum]|uniref:Uncharacterized protein n=1 Tax=Panicum virgatum TaxID=38727 RepID=A0A8T0V889_PANVG|nr:hypothetical protein PVAP13_3KG548432 [Panicum virgatum]